LNMHFGLWRKGLNPLKLEPMLEAMNQLVLESLALSGEQQCRVADLGCGIGATLRPLAAACPRWTLPGISRTRCRTHPAGSHGFL
jgi:cyclopropane fatty-acyl-phospholipid synthase-like methyltransferase